MNTKEVSAKIEIGGRGYYLDPPGYPNKEYHVKSDIGYYCISEVPKNPLLSEEIKEECNQLLEKWNENKKPLYNEEVKQWILYILGYFEKSTYDTDIENFIYGVNHIKKYYPEYQATRTDYEKAGQIETILHRNKKYIARLKGYSLYEDMYVDKIYYLKRKILKNISKCPHSFSKKENHVSYCINCGFEKDNKNKEVVCLGFKIF